MTIQAQILELMKELREQNGMAIMLITHDLGVVAEMADEVVVMYAGKVVERADADTVFERPHHPYTQGLLASIPRLGERRERLEVIRGIGPQPAQPAEPAASSSGAARTRCRSATRPPPFQRGREPGHLSALLADPGRRAAGRRGRRTAGRRRGRGRSG